MPHKLNPRSRAWGTRFDSLPSSSPPSPMSPNATQSDVSRPPVSLSQEQVADSPTKKKDERLPHDASVFVGSLPAGIDQSELSRLLSDHLAEHAEVKSVKVIRDSRGGVCAFVQCEDAVSAANLIHTLRSTAPKPFLGRTLRFEPARAFRTLLISYRTPTETMPANFNPTTDKTTPAKSIELDLPFAMRFWKPRNAKHLTIFYNTDAIEAGRQAKAEPDEQSNDPVLHMEPVLFNVAALRAICAHFGTLEYFKAYGEIGNGGDHTIATVFPSPHDAPRKPNMDGGCYEVKWAHRDDCVSALMTLRRVPHLTVTWAHSPPSYASSDRDIANSGRLNYANVAPYPMYAQRRSAATTSGSEHSRVPSINEHSIVADADLHTPFSPTIGAQQQWRAMVQHSSRDLSTSTLVDTTSNQSVAWFEADFPPLVECKNEHRSDLNGVWVEQKPTSTSTQKLNDGFLDGTSSESHSLDVPSRSDVLDMLNNTQSFRSDSGQPITTTSDHPEDEQDYELDNTPALDRSPVTPKTPGSIFPPTPTAYLSERPAFFSKDEGENDRFGLYEGMPSERALDPTTLFVGGLEMYGPGAWDEAKVENFFRRFGGLESVRVIRPSGGKAAFAFVKFNNTESPARAVQEEHNHVFEGRAMRVQFRDCNPPRGAWRPGRGGRGRCFNHHHGVFHYRQNLEAGHSREKFGSTESSTPGSPNDARYQETVCEHSDVSAPSPPAAGELANVETNQAQTTEPGQAAASPGSNALEHTQRYREWYEIGETQTSSTNVTPPPVPFVGPETMPSGPPTHVPGSYYPSWPLQPYPHMQYPMPYVAGYPMYPLPNGQPQRHPSTGGSDSNGTLPPSPGAWAPVGYGYLPYPGYHSRVPSDDHSASQMQLPTHGQAPVMPAGFLQHEQGTLIAVYPPEAIDQYMSNRQAGPGASSQSRVSAGVPVTSAPLPSPVPPVWPPYPPPPFTVNQVPRNGQPAGLYQAPVYPLGMPVPVPNWMPPNHSGVGPSFALSRPHQMIPPSMGMPIANGSPYRSHHDSTGALNKRQGGRRDHFNGHRNPHGRRTPNRNPRALPFADNHTRMEQLNGNGNSADYNQWGNARRDTPKNFIS